MNIGFFDPISERWIKPRPEKEPESPSYQSMADALLSALAAAAQKERNEKIWAYLKQSAEGCNHVPVAESPIIVEVPEDYQII